MKGLFRRPLALGSALFLLYLFLSLRSGGFLALPFSLLFLSGALICLGAALLGTPASQRNLRYALLMTAGIAFAVSLAFFSSYRVVKVESDRSIRLYDKAEADIELTVTEIEASTSYSTTILCHLNELNGKTMHSKGRLYLPYAADCSVGDEIALSAIISPLGPDSGTLQDCYDYSQGIVFTAEATVSSHRLLSQRKLFPESQLHTLRTAIQRRFYPYLNMEENGLISSLLIGDRTNLSPEFSRSFRNLGISHTLAVSGLHLGILCGSLLWILRRFRLPRVAELPILLPCLLIYAALVGSPSVLRAGGMLLFTFFAFPLGRRRDSLTSLLVTVAAICLISPESVLDIGLLLSLFATFGILLIGIPLSRRIQSLAQWMRVPLTALAITASATLFTLPFSVWYFGEWAILSPLANLILVPMITLLLYLAPLLLILSPLPALAYTPALLIKGLILLLKWLTDFFAANDYLLLPLNLPIIQIAAILCIAFVIPICFIAKARPAALVILVLFLSFAGGYCTLHATTLLSRRSVLPLTDGENDCLILRAGTRSVLIDHSHGGYGFLTDAITLGEEDPLVRVDALMLTHYHYRQIATVTRLLDGGRLEYLILPKPAEKDRNTAEVLSARAQRSGCHVRWYSNEDSIILYHDLEIQVDFLGREDHPLSAVTIRFQDEAFVYSADVTGDFSSDALQGKHHRPFNSAKDRRWGRLYEFSPPA